MGPRGPKHYIFGHQIYSKNARKRKKEVVNFVLIMGPRRSEL